MISLAAIFLAFQPVAPAASAAQLAVSPPEQSVEAYSAEWKSAVAEWRACDFPRETYRYVQAMAEMLVQTKAYALQGHRPGPVKPEYSSYQAGGESCMTLAAGMDPIIAAFNAAQNRPGLLRAWRAPES